jgi:hypothetical protein
MRHPSQAIDEDAPIGRTGMNQVRKVLRSTTQMSSMPAIE